MDEVDGMSASDRGGVAELIKLLKTSKVPIICICNDRQSVKVKSESVPPAPTQAPPCRPWGTR